MKEYKRKGDSILAIEIQRAVIHILDRDSDEPVFNDFELEINSDISTFLEKHISKSINDEEARKAKFKEGINIIKEVSDRMATDLSYFLEGSKEIARQLFKAMKTNSSISSTDLIICMYEIEAEVNIAILKMDYTTSFIHDVEMVDEKFKISIKKQDISLPNIGQKIQKCAFVRGNQNVQDYNLIILDNQINKKNEEPIAQFFLHTFLSAELIVDNKIQTKIFKTETENWIRAKAEEGEHFVETIREHVNNIVHEQEEIDMKDFSYKVFGNKQDLREDYLKSMEEKGLANEKFEVDKGWVEKKLNRIRFKTESNIEIIIGYEYFNDKNKFEIVNNPDGSRNIIIKNVGSIFQS